VLTVRLTCLVVVPPRPEAVSAYVVVRVGLTTTEPDNGLLPTPLSMETVVAFVVVQVSVDDAPVVIVVGLALNVTIGAG
jgi:hypothetical protein